MKKLTFIAFAFIVSVNAFAQSKPRKVTIKKSVTISKDSTYYLPDTIVCVFKELVIKPDTVYEKWNRGFVVWQTWKIASYGLMGTTSFSGGYITLNSEVKPYKDEYYFTRETEGKFLYQNYQPVTNKVINAYKP